MTAVQVFMIQVDSRQLVVGVSLIIVDSPIRVNAAGVQREIVFVLFCQYATPNHGYGIQ